MEDEMGRAFSTNWEKRNAYKILVGKPEENRQLKRPFRHTTSLAGPWSVSLKSGPKGLSSKKLFHCRANYFSSSSLARQILKTVHFWISRQKQCKL
jgi:hypothetical protein